MTDRYQPYQFPDLTHLFAPRSIAVVGASEKPNSIGHHTFSNIVEHSTFDGPVFAVNPKQDSVLGYDCVATVADLPQAVDVVMVVVPAKFVCDAVAQAGKLGCKFAVILTSGFSEADEWGQEEERKLVSISNSTGIRIYGPNCPGLVNVNLPLGMTFSPVFRYDDSPGPIGIATQGGGLGRNIMQHTTRGVGFACWASSGNECDLQVADFVHHMAQDPEIRVITCLVEGFKDGARFASACAEAARKGKPVVGLKIGRSAYGAAAAASHTASITGSAEVNSTVFRQLGVIEVDDIDEMIDVASLLARKIPSGNEKVAIFASSGGAASLCADSVGIADLKLATFTAETSKRLAEVLPDYAAMSNPIDTTSVVMSNPEIYKDSLLACAMDPDVGLVLEPVPMDYSRYTGSNAKALVEIQQQVDIPLVPIWMSERTGEGYDVFAAAGVTPLKSLRNMGKAVRRWLDYGKWLAAHDAGWTPALIEEGVKPASDKTAVISEIEGKKRLTAAGVPAATAQLATTRDAAMALARELGVPLAMKIVSPEITHKSDVGGVRLNVSPAEAGEAFDLIVANSKSAVPTATLDGVLIEPMAPKGQAEAFVGISRDPVFGQIMTFGLGGIYVEMFADVSRRMLPVTQATAFEMISELRSAPLLTGSRGQEPCDLNALTSLIVAVSDFALSQPDLRELDINPVWVGRAGQGAMALDAVLVLDQ